MARTNTLLAGIVLIGFAFAGCFGGGSASSDEPPYKGQFKEFDLYLHGYQGNNGWTLWTDGFVDAAGDTNERPVMVDAWLWGDTEDPASGKLPGPTIRAREGDTVRINFHVLGAGMMPHTIHWHGLHVPWDQDGVPYVSQLPVGDTNDVGGSAIEGNLFTYEFKLNQSGTYFYHCHVDTAHHMDMGMYGSFIVDPADPKQDPPYDREYTLVLDEWQASHVHSQTNTGTLTGKSGDPETISGNVYSQVRDIYNNHPTLTDAKEDAGLKSERTWYPAQFPAYFPEYDTYLINGKAFPDTEMLFINPGETIRIRVINAGFEWHALHLHGHRMYETHKDGSLEPDIRRLRDASGLDTEDELADYAKGHDTISIGPAERYDIYVFGNNPGPWMIHDHVATNEANDHISPGGMMTMLCYESGWEPSPQLGNPCKAAEMGGMSSGEFLVKQHDLLAIKHQREGVRVVLG